MSWWRHQMETFSALFDICRHRPVTQSFDAFFDLRLNKHLSKQSWDWYLRRHCAHYDVSVMITLVLIFVLGNKETCNVLPVYCDYSPKDYGILTTSYSCCHYSKATLKPRNSYLIGDILTFKTYAQHHFVAYQIFSSVEDQHSVDNVLSNNAFSSRKYLVYLFFQYGISVSLPESKILNHRKQFIVNDILTFEIAGSQLTYQFIFCIRKYFILWRWSISPVLRFATLLYTSKCAQPILVAFLKFQCYNRK